MPKLIIILTALLILVVGCQKNSDLQQEQPDKAHFLDPYIGTYEGTLEYSLDDKVYLSTWDLQCTQDLIYAKDTSYQLFTVVTVSKDSANVITVDDEFDEMDRTFEIDSTLFYQDISTPGILVDHYYTYQFKQGTDSLYLHSDLNVWDYECQQKFEDYFFSLKKVN